MNKIKKATSRLNNAIHNNRLETITGVCFSVSMFIMLTDNYFNYSQFVKLIAIVLFLITLVFFNFFDALTGMLFTLVIQIFVLSSLLVWSESNYDITLLKKIAVMTTLFFLILLFNILKTSFSLSKIKKPQNKVLIVVYNLRFVYPVVSYFILEWIIIFAFALLYEGFNNYAILNCVTDGIKYTSTNMFLTSFDALYFSMVTFYTVGYGDIVPVGDIPKLLASVEMFIGSKLVVMIFPILFLVITQMILSKKEL